MQISVSSRAHRALRKLRRYRSGDRDSPLSLEGIPVAGDQTCIGVYENNPGTLDNAVVITDRGLRIRRHGDWRFVPYREIAEVRMDKTPDVAELELHLVDGSIFHLPVTGGDMDEGTRDVACFMGFLVNVLNDLQQE